MFLLYVNPVAMSKFYVAILVYFMPACLSAQSHTPLPHGMRYGKIADTSLAITADKLEVFMGKKTRISTTVNGTVLKVDNPKGGWFSLDAGNGRIIKAHFQNYDVTIPRDMKGRKVMVQGIAERLFVADDMQHYAGDKATGNRQHKTDPTQRISFEVTGLMVL